MSSTMLSGILPSGVDVERLANTIVKVKRRRMAEAMAAASEDLTEVGVRDNIIEMENAVIDEMDGDVPEIADSALRVMAQEAILDKMDECGEDDGQED